MKSIVTGATGFAGGFLVQHLLESGDQVLGSSREDHWPADLDHLRAETNLVIWDVAEDPPADSLDRMRAFQPDVVFHLAGISLPRECGGKEPTAASLEVNVGGARRASQLAAQLGARLLLVSSCYVYGDVTAKNCRVRETDRLRPSGGYGVTKVQAEQAVAAASSPEFVIVRAFNHTGPRQSPELMLPEWCRQFARPGPVRVRSRNSYLDLTDVRDMVVAYRLLAEHGQAGETYNVGSGIQRRSGDILEILAQRYDADRKIIELSPSEQYLPIADTDRVRATCGWQPRIPLTETIEDTMEYWIERERNR